MLWKSDPAVLVTGATGFIGRHVVTRLLLAGRRVMILARRRAGLTGEQRVAEIFGEISRRSLEVWKEIWQILLGFRVRLGTPGQPSIP